jgi:arylsulfatase A-like enzyme
LDQRVAFDERPSSINLPELDRFKSESFISTNAYPPANYTAFSMPALISGRLVSSATPINPHDMMLKFEGAGTAVKWNEQPNVFSDARNAGSKTAVVGWYHPYCRVLGDNVDSCFVAGEETDQWTLYQVMAEQWERTFNTIPFIQDYSNRSGLENRLPNVAFFREHQVETYNEVMEQVKQVSGRKEFGLLLFHFPVPHPPGIFNRNTGAMTDQLGRSYLDNLALADKSLGEIRRSMEAAGTWDDTTVIVTADHWWRTEVWKGSAWTAEEDAASGGKTDHRVPFMIKLAGHTDPFVYNQTFNTVLLRDFLNAIRNNQVTGPGGIAQWLDGHRTIGESPYRGG